MFKRRKFSPTEREFIAQRANERCEYCQIPADFSPESFEIEHIAPLSKGGTNELDNLAWACGGCNSRKGGRTYGVDTVTQKPAPLFHPRTDYWDEHFGWHDSDTQVEGRTATGRVTVETLELNRKGLINLRKVLSLIGIHPPE